jgi:hypothetical protein
MPVATGLFPLGDAIEERPWMGARPCFADSRRHGYRTPAQVRADQCRLDPNATANLKLAA